MEIVGVPERKGVRQFEKLGLEAPLVLPYLEELDLQLQICELHENTVHTAGCYLSCHGHCFDSTPVV